MMKTTRRILVLLLALLLSGCKLAVLNPKGVIAAAEKQLLVDSVLLMLIVVIPAILLSFIFGWRYRAKNKSAAYAPDWAHSTILEVVCWFIPCAIIVFLATLTWITTHRLDPYRPLAPNKKPVVIQVVALDWKWLFIYPNQHIATVNYIQIPVNEPVRFDITADAPMNSLAIPQLAGQIYAMPGMRTKLHIMANTIGKYYGLSTSFSGDGFSGMNFFVQVTSAKDYAKWVKQMQRKRNPLSVSAYRQLEKPSEYNHPAYYSPVAKDLFSKIIKKYMKPNATLAQKQ